jgi:hypothetical protein
MPLARRIAYLALPLLAALLAPARRCAAQLPALLLVDTAVLRAPRLNESSGVVASRRHPGIFWTHNDNDDAPVLYTTDSTGADLGFVRVRGTRNEDWEDLSVGPCTRGTGTCLFIADIGDNRSRRTTVAIYVVAEPDPPAGPGDTMRIVPVLDTIRLRYPDQPHNAEALAVANGHLLIVTKDLTGPAVLFRTAIAGNDIRLLTRVGALDMRTSALRGRIATGAAASADGRILAVRTYASIHLFALGAGLPVPLTGPRGLGIPVIETQGEAIAFDLQGRLVLTSERGDRGHAILTRLRLTGMAGP